MNHKRNIDFHNQTSRGVPLVKIQFLNLHHQQLTTHKGLRPCHLHFVSFPWYKKLLAKKIEKNLKVEP